MVCVVGGTAVALHLGHRVSVDFDFFRAEPLHKADIETSFQFVQNARTIQEDENTLVMSVPMPSGPGKVSFFGGLALDRINDPVRTKDRVLLVASLEELLATKLKAILDRAEAKDYRDISAMLSAGVSLEKALGAFAVNYRRDPTLPPRPWGSSRTAICRPFQKPTRISCARREIGFQRPRGVSVEGNASRRVKSMRR
ncbi:nucleotidyl transferase AbiEii/AbiGii toxin family protein [Bradyrhizobium sp. BWA-3-5]|uniref:nucleotidyl transferase AbiEii/AbiGii toxin family protein n=1 Tax=Bradyrhizobium sp. BWA-3-5 TaxID=3080013 RepID=UPI00293F2E07|nr:nucleotidyl transferase AbiEii/AbiGii toxin family protein [Bradyrhizobium sp. BWA-3-5]WOH69748.1 nucleotidyl transferase AbiEii/AbiGii toxin family protein [Bradyrhizobium sp. BWA-3-5]